MFYNIFLIRFMLIMSINIKITNNSLLSRLRNPNDYVPKEKYYFPEDIDDDLYADLLMEVPELAGKLRYNENEVPENTIPPFITKNTKVSSEIVPNVEEFDTEEEEDQEEYLEHSEYTTVTQSLTKIISSSPWMPFLTRSPINSSDELLRNLDQVPIGRDNIPNKKRVAKCYWCGMNQSTSIPKHSLCYDAFESSDWRKRTMSRFFRAICYESKEIVNQIRAYRFSNTWRGLLRLKFGWYFGGCFKRFLDVGTVYTQRGCRSFWPLYSSRYNFVDHRFVRMEATIKKQKEICIVSPMASLTPFSRSISLYVRYHVCVCEGKYCNGTTKLKHSLLLMISIILVLLRIS